ncbi:MAG TPA: hypothetical protein VNM90_06670, partial [Haliangium sp.]|nr:hypothetical protein [Haliangium sp.]
ELRELLMHGGEVVLAFDTNAIFGNRFLDLCDNINKLNSLWRPRRIRKLVAAPVHVEKLHDLHQKKKESFDPALIMQVLGEKQIEIVSFEQHHAEHVAGMLGALYPSTQDWRGFKRQRCLACVGLLHRADEAKAGGKRCGATIDWLVAGHADLEGYVLVTDDGGPEFKSVRRKAKLKSVVKVVDEVLRAAGASP